VRVKLRVESATAGALAPAEYQWSAPEVYQTAAMASDVWRAPVRTCHQKRVSGWAESLSDAKAEWATGMSLRRERDRPEAKLE
jgi:hypothetical protein